MILLSSAALLLPACEDSSAQAELEPESSATATASEDSSSAPTAGTDDSVSEAPTARDSEQQAASSPEIEQKPTTPAPVYRPPDRRPVWDDDRLAALGIHRVDSRRLILYSDLPVEEIDHLPELVDALYPVWVAYFGALPPDRSGGDFQITGYLMRDEDLFRSAGLVPTDLPRFQTGRNRGRQFWMHAQDYEYFQEHVVLHEATHCFMMVLPDSLGPPWYMEGMAEYFALHRRNQAGQWEFAAIPPPLPEMMGFDRIRVIREEIAAGRFKTLDEIARIPAHAFLETPPYAWSWACCLFLSQHPRYAERFHNLGSPRIRRRLQTKMQHAFADDAEILPIEWAFFAHEITHDYQFKAMTIDFPPATRLEAGQGQSRIVSAEASWQPSQLRLVAGRTYRIEAKGTVVLAQQPHPWRSDPDGITFDYAHGSPLGQLQAAILVDDLTRSPDPAGGFLSPISIGQQGRITPTATGRLYFRVNDHANNLRNNSGEYVVRISSVGE